jgi:hypothetical protein
MGEAEQVVCRVLKEIPEPFLGIDGKTYPACKQGDVITLPRENASALQGAGAVQVLQGLETESKIKITDVHSDAMMILRHGDPIAFFYKAFSRIHHGDKEVFLILMVSLGAQMCSNTAGIQPSLTGESGKGKTHTCLSLYHLLDGGDYKRRGSFSPLSLHYDENLKDGAVILLDDVQNLDLQIQDIIKQATSSFQERFTRHTVIKQKGVEIQIKARLVFWITTVSASFDMQFLYRQFMTGVNDSKEQDRAVMEKILQDEMDGINPFEITQTVKTCREIDRILKSKPLIHVQIPFAKNLKWNNSENRRNLSMFLDTIKAFTAWNQCQRDKTEDGKVIATLEDYKAALQLWKYAAREQVSKLSKDELLFLQLLKEHGESSYTGMVEIERPALQEILNWSSTKMTRIIHGENGAGGLESKVKGFRVDKHSKKIPTHDGKERTINNLEVLIYTGEMDLLGQYEDVVWYESNL